MRFRMTRLNLSEQDKADKTEAAPPPDSMTQMDALAKLIAGVLTDSSLDKATKRKKINALIDHAEGMGGNGNGAGAEPPPLSEQTRREEYARRVTFYGIEEQTRERERILNGDVPPVNPALRKAWLRR